jgi:hypothetical protein
MKRIPLFPPLNDRAMTRSFPQWSWVTVLLVLLGSACGIFPRFAYADIHVVIPTLNPKELVVAAATPQEFGAVGDGKTDDTAAFQQAIDKVYHEGGSGGGVVFVPAGNYAFYKNLNIPTGVTLHGDWADWTKGNGGIVGTTFEVYASDTADGTPFLTVGDSAALRDVNIWYPSQSASSIQPYPFTLKVGTDSVVQNVVLVNSYQGITSKSAKHILSSVIGTPLFMGIKIDSVADIVHSEDIRFAPDIWTKSRLPNAPAANGPQADWMRANGTGMLLKRVDGQLNIDTNISGYKVGIETESGDGGQPGATFYKGSITKCGTALLAEEMPGALGLVFAEMTFDGDIGVSRTHTSTNANVLFYHCTITGNSGPAVTMSGKDAGSWMQFQNCTINGTLQLNNGVFNVVNSTLTGNQQATVSDQATMASFTGCTFTGIKNIVTQKDGNSLVEDRPASTMTMPLFDWAKVKDDYLTRRPAKTDLFLATDYGVTGDGDTDDTAAIQKALNAAGTNGGGLVYLAGGTYKLTDTLTVPSGVELRGPYEMRHRTWPAGDGKPKGAILEPYGGEGSATGPPAIALQANSGIVGLTISYESQSNKCEPFPPTIQGQGANVYAIGIQCPNPFWYVDLDTYSCPNHFLYMVDGWDINMGFKIGHGSSGTVVDCQGNWTYWVDNYSSHNNLSGPRQPPVEQYVYHNSTGFQLGHCTETMVKDFNIIENTFIRFVTEDGQGPNVNMIGCYCDASIKGMILDSASGTINAINTPMCVFAGDDVADLKSQTFGVQSTANFHGTARLFNTILFASPHLDFDINGGDVGAVNMHMNGHSYIGSQVNGGVFHLINCSSNQASGGPSDHPPYTVAFQAQAGLPGKTSEVIGNYTRSGYTVKNDGSVPVNVWGNFPLDAQSQ